MNAENIDNQTGSLTIRVETGYGIYPLESAFISVYAENDEDTTVVSQSYTDSSGSTPKIVLAVSGDNDRGEYLPIGQTFTIEVSKDGYQTLVYHGVQLYPLIDTILSVNLSPLPDRPGVKLTPYDGEIVS